MLALGGSGKLVGVAGVDPRKADGCWAIVATAMIPRLGGVG